MKVSIITVVRNNEATIAHAINSVLSQDYPNIEYIVIDGVTKDSKVDIFNSYGRKITRLISRSAEGRKDGMIKGLK